MSSKAAPVVAALLFTGCSAAPSGPAQAVTPSATPPGPAQAVTPSATPSAPQAAVAVARWTPTPARMLATMTGRLVTSGGCLAIAPGGGAPMVLVLPYGRGTWDAAAEVLTLDGKSYRRGDPIVVGGGSVPRDSDRLTSAPSMIPPCGGAMLFLVG